MYLKPKTFINTSLDAAQVPRITLSWLFGQSLFSGEVSLSLMYLFSTCWLDPLRWGVRRNTSRQILGCSKISISIPLLTTGPELRSTFKNHKASPVKDYPLASIQSLPSLIVVGHDQQKQEGRRVTTLQILRSHDVLLHKASREIKVFTIRFSDLRQMHLLSAVPNSPTLQPAPTFCKAHSNCYR